MIEIALRRIESRIVAGPTVADWELGEVEQRMPPVIGLGWGLRLALSWQAP